MMKTKLARAIAFYVGITLLATPNGFTAPATHLGKPSLTSLSAPINPCNLKGIRLYPDNPFKFDFIIDDGNAHLSEEALKEETGRLVRYFLAGLTLPEKDLWVNLSPYEQDRIIPASLATTEMGEDMLDNDYILKQLSASLTYPESESGKQYWRTIYEKAGVKGKDNSGVGSFQKIWIVPADAVIYEDEDKAFITQSRLKVMLEEDYLAKKASLSPELTEAADIARGAAQTMREVILPSIEKEVNCDKNFIRVRQMYHCLLLASWFKQKLKNHIVNRLYADKAKIKGIDLAKPGAKEKVYNQYLKTFQQGVYNYIKRDFDPSRKKITRRRYYSGGIGWAGNVGETERQGARSWDSQAVGKGLNTGDRRATVQLCDRQGTPFQDKIAGAMYKIMPPKPGVAGQAVAVIAEELRRIRQTETLSADIFLTSYWDPVFDRIGRVDLIPHALPYLQAALKPAADLYNRGGRVSAEYLAQEGLKVLGVELVDSGASAGNSAAPSTEAIVVLGTGLSSAAADIVKDNFRLIMRQGQMWNTILLESYWRDVFRQAGRLDLLEEAIPFIKLALSPAVAHYEEQGAIFAVDFARLALQALEEDEAVFGSEEKWASDKAADFVAAVDREADPMSSNFYRRLGVIAQASADEIRKAYQVLAVKYHPDRLGDASNRSMVNINLAFQTLSDPQKRRAYDRIAGAMSNQVSTTVNRLNALRRWLRINQIDIEQWAMQENQKTNQADKGNLQQALAKLVAAGVIQTGEITGLMDKIILVDIPAGINLQGKTSSVEALIIDTAQGRRILFPRSSVAEISLEDSSYLYHEISEERRYEQYLAQYLADSMPLDEAVKQARDRAHKDALTDRDALINGGIDLDLKAADITVKGKGISLMYDFDLPSDITRNFDGFGYKLTRFEKIAG